MRHDRFDDICDKIPIEAFLIEWVPVEAFPIEWVPVEAFPIERLIIQKRLMAQKRHRPAEEVEQVSR